jgi:hypothetical protein
MLDIHFIECLGCLRFKGITIFFDPLHFALPLDFFCKSISKLYLKLFAI